VVVQILASALSRETVSNFAGEKLGDSGAAVRSAAVTISPKCFAYLVVLFSFFMVTIKQPLPASCVSSLTEIKFKWVAANWQPVHCTLWEMERSPTSPDYSAESSSRTNASATTHCMPF